MTKEPDTRGRSPTKTRLSAMALVSLVVAGCDGPEIDQDDILGRLMSGVDAPLSDTFPKADKICVVPEYTHTTDFSDHNGVEIERQEYVPENKNLIILIDKTGGQSTILTGSSWGDDTIVLRASGCFDITSTMMTLETHYFGGTGGEFQQADLAPAEI